MDCSNVKEIPVQRIPVQQMNNATKPCVSVTNYHGDGVIEFYTDVKGDWEYFMRLVSLSNILFWEGPHRGAFGPGTLVLKDGGIFVFGGDAVDKGTGDVRVVKTLVQLKEKYWDRVFILLGDRDVAKLRFLSELAPGETGHSFEERGGAYWLSEEVRKNGYADYLLKTGLKSDSVSTCKWILGCTMGCGKTFECRRHELALLRGAAGIGSGISDAGDEDAAIARSFADSVDPVSNDPWMLALLRCGQLALMVRDCLFVHADLDEGSLYAVPNESNIERVESLPEWVAKLNAWKESQIADFERRPGWRKEGDAWRRGGDGLIDYGTPRGCGIPGLFAKCSVISTSSRNGNLCLSSAMVEGAMAQWGIHFILSGHQPHGDAPTVVRHSTTGLLAITADTSLSDLSALKLFNPANDRGHAVSIVRICRDVVQIKGILRDGCPHECTLHIDPMRDAMPDALVGRQLQDGSWVKTIDLESKAAVCGFVYPPSDDVVYEPDGCGKYVMVKKSPGQASMSLKRNFISEQEALRIPPDVSGLLGSPAEDPLGAANARHTTTIVPPRRLGPRMAGASSEANEKAEKDRQLYHKTISKELGINAAWVLAELKNLVQQKVPDIEDPDFIEMSQVIAYGDQAIGKKILCPRDGLPDASIVDALFPQHSGIATIFVSWVWTYKLGSALSAINEYCNREKSPSEHINIWWCFFCNNQFRILGDGDVLTTEELRSVFGSQVAQIGKMLIMLDALYDPGYIKRIWCIYEVFVCAERRIPIEITMPLEAKNLMESQLELSGLGQIKKSLRITSANAKATMPADEESIKKLIRTHSSFQEVDGTVKAALLKEIMAVIAAVLEKEDD